MSLKALYSGSFDPITYGHLDIIRRAYEVFNDLTIVVGNNPNKKYTFDIQSRVNFIRHALSGTSINVVPIENKLIIDFAYENNIKVIIKGIRNIQDYDYEKMTHEINITQQRGIDTYLLIAKQSLSYISSSATKELCRYQGFIHEYVTPCVKDALERKVNKQVIFGLTGGIASGKSYVAERLVKDATLCGIEIHNVDLDIIAHEIIESLSEPVYRNLRNDIAKEFGPKCIDSRKILGDIVFSNTQKLQTLNKLMRVPILTRLRSIISTMKGIILLNSAILVEADMLSMCNNNVIVVAANPQLQKERLVKRGLDNTQIMRRLSCQYTQYQRLYKIRSKISESNWGSLEIIDCNQPFPVWDARKIYDVFKVMGNSESFYEGQ